MKPILDIIAGKTLSIDKAMTCIESENTVVTAMAAAEPQILYQNFDRRLRHLSGVKVYCANPAQDYPCFNHETMKNHVSFIVMFLTASVRARQGDNFLHYIPQHLSQWSSNLLARNSIDVFWGSCSLPDERGVVSLGPSCCYESEMLRAAKKVVLEINPHIPRTAGATVVRQEDIDIFVESKQALPTVSAVQSNATDEAIAAHVASLVADGSTIQLGIGSIPNAIAVALRNKKDLGVHTEMINDAMMDLCLRGVVTGRHKTLWPDKIVGAFAFGSAELYHFLDQNDMVELHPAAVVNDPYRISRNHRMTSINTAVEVDLTGQVCSESIGHRELSGVGGAFDTHVGAQRAQGGRGIIALHATRISKTGLLYSKLVLELKPGAKVSISRNDTDTIVTEYGIAELKGRSVAERARAIINIAHPQFREQLSEQAKQQCYI